MRTSLLVVLAGTACTAARGPEDPAGWYDSGVEYGVQEPVAFTSDPYDLDGGIGALDAAVLPVTSDDLLYAPDEALPSGSGCPLALATEPAAEAWTVTGVVTVHPRFYFKTSGCSYDSDEKYSGSYFIEDDTGGFFVLGDSKVAHFDVGDTVEMKVRAVRTNFDLDMVYAHDIVSVERTARAVRYREATDALGADDVARVVRVEGVVTREKDTFGEVLVESDDGIEYSVGLDVELNRRGVDLPLGTRLRATGPVLLSYDIYSIVIMRIGQLEILETD
jgi:hypothetical protein